MTFRDRLKQLKDVYSKEERLGRPRYSRKNPAANAEKAAIHGNGVEFQGSAITYKGRGIAIIGPSGAGKSRIAYHLVDKPINVKQDPTGGIELANGVGALHVTEEKFGVALNESGEPFIVAPHAQDRLRTWHGFALKKVSELREAGAGTQEIERFSKTLKPGTEKRKPWFFPEDPLEPNRRLRMLFLVLPLKNFKKTVVREATESEIAQHLSTLPPEEFPTFFEEEKTHSAEGVKKMSDSDKKKVARTIAERLAKGGVKFSSVIVPKDDAAVEQRLRDEDTLGGKPSISSRFQAAMKIRQILQKNMDQTN